MRPEEWLLIEWPEGEAEPAKYFLTTAPEDATLKQMVFVTKMRGYAAYQRMHTRMTSIGKRIPLVASISFNPFQSKRSA